MVPSYGGSNPPAPARPRRPLRWLLPALALPAAPAAAQQQDAQAWFQLNANIPLADRWRVTLEQITRFSDRQEGLYQTEFGGLIGWKAGDNIELGAGYRRVGFHSANRAPDENRLRQQIVATFGRVTMRLRVDERFLTTGGEVGVRIRPLIRYAYPLGHGVALFAGHESFLIPNSTALGQRSGYERMRNQAGVTMPLGRRVSADLGYLNQYRFGRGGARGQMDHALNVQLTLNLAPMHHAHNDD